MSNNYLVQKTALVKLWDFPPLPQLIDETCEQFKNRQQTPQERKIFFRL